MSAERPLAGVEPHQLRDVEGLDREHDDHNHAERQLHGAFVVEGSGREVGAEHQAVTAAFRVRTAMPTSGPRMSITSGVTEIRSVSAAVRVGSIGSTDAASR